MDDDFQKFFRSIAEAVVCATLVVSLGKYLTDAYLFLFLGTVTLAVLTLEGYKFDKIRKKDIALRHLKACSLQQHNNSMIKRRERKSIAKTKSQSSASSTEVAKKRNRKEAAHKKSPTTPSTTNNSSNDKTDGEVSVIKRKVNLRQRLKSKVEKAIEKTKRRSLPANFFEDVLSKNQSNHNSVEILDNG